MTDSDASGSSAPPRTDTNVSQSPSSSRHGGLSKLRSRLSSKRDRGSEKEVPLHVETQTDKATASGSRSPRSSVSRHQRSGSSKSQHADTPHPDKQAPTPAQEGYDIKSSTTPQRETTPARQFENPLKTQSTYIIRYFCASSIFLIVIVRIAHWSVAAVISAILISTLQNQLARAADDAQWEKETYSRETYDGDGPRSETVEWMNAVLKTLWPLISQDIFVPFVDLLEDALMLQVPPIVHSCRVEDLDQGSIPLQISSFVLLDSHEDAFTSGAGTIQALNEQEKEDEELPMDTGDYVNLEITFTYRSPAARRQKGKTNKGRSVTGEDEEASRGRDSSFDESNLPVDQIHLLIYMAIGLQKIAAVEVPVWCEMLGIEGKMRLRLQFVPNAPFISHVAFTFLGLPKLEISAKPLGRRMVIDAMHLPLISTYVLHSVEAVVKDFIAPKSYTVDVGGMLGAGDGPRNVYSLGVIVLILHHGIELPAADVNGLCDPFVSVAFARAGKTLFTSRIITKSRDALWQEMCVLLVSSDEVRDHEKLRLTVFDADRYSADDPLGKVEVSIDKLIHRTGHHRLEAGSPTLFESRTDDLQPMRKGGEAISGKLKYSVGFYRLAKPLGGTRSAAKQDLLRQAAQRGMKSSSDSGPQEAGEKVEDVSSPTDDKDHATGEDDGDLASFTTPFDRFVHSIGLPLDEDVLRRRKERKGRVRKLTAMMQGEEQATLGPPNPDYHSGILAFHIHSIDGLGFEGTQKSLANAKRLTQKSKTPADEDAMGEGSNKMPNSFVQVVLNDEAIFRSRTKPLNPRPYINAGSERWVTDFSTARIDFVVRDQRMRENNPILGIAGLKVASVLVDTSRTTQWYTLTGGLGWGKIRVTLLWRSAEVTIPKQLRGWNVGVIEVAHCAISGIAKSSFERREAHMMFETVGGRAETEPVVPFEEYESGEGEHATIGFRWPMKEPVRIAVRQRYPNFLYIHLRSDSRVPGRVHKHAHSVISLSRLIDGQETMRRIPIFETSDWQQFEQEILKSMTKDDQLASPTPVDMVQLPVLEQMCSTSESHIDDSSHLRKIGYLDITLVFYPGVSLEHKALTAGDHEMRIAYESFIALMDAGERPRPKMTSASRRRKLSAGAAGLTETMRAQSPSAAGAGQENSEDMRAGPGDLHIKTEGLTSGSEDGRIRTATTPPPDTASTSRRNSRDGLTDDEEISGLDDEDFEEVDSPKGRRARASALHRQQRGAAQVKGFRTLDWIKTNVEDGVGSFKRNAHQQRSKRIAKMESEGVSHF